MDDPSNSPSLLHRLLRVSLPAVVVVALIAASTWWWFSQREAGVSSTTDVADSVAPGSAPEAPDQIEQMLVRARDALNERRLLAPAGDNAVQIYLAVLDRQADHRVARQALLELIPPAAQAVEAAIATGDFMEARRQLDLVKQMGASDLRLSAIRAELTEAESAAERSAAAAVAEAAAAAIAGSPQADASGEPLISAAAVPETTQPGFVATPTPVPAAAPAPAKPTPPAVADPPSATSIAAQAPVAATPVESRSAAATTSGTAAAVVEPRQTLDVPPAYPSQAKQRRVEGWVELEFAVGTDGKVGEIVVVGSEPPRIFDREAVRAAARWRFEPRRENGVAVATRVRKTVSFKFN